MNIAVILDDCLACVAHGESAADCLARYPDQADELAPMLAAAGRLRSLASCELTTAQRLAGVAAIQRAWATQPPSQKASGWPAWLGRWIATTKHPALAAVVALCLFVALSAGVVAASQPGDLAYGVRVIVERAPALMIVDSGARAAGELNLAERRLADLQHALQRSRQADSTALAALIRSDAAAAAAAERLTAVERRQLAARVEAHADRLTQLAETMPEPTAAQSLAQAAAQAQEIAQRLRQAPRDAGPSEPPQRPISPAETPDAAMPPTATPTRPAATPTTTAQPTGAPTSRMRESETPRRPALTATRAEWATAIAATATARPTLEPPRATLSPPPIIATRRAEHTAEPPRATLSPPPIIATRRAEHTAEPPRATLSPPPIIATRRAEHTAEPPRATLSPPPIIATRRAEHTAEPPRPTDNPGGPPAATPGPQPTRRR